MAQQVVTREEWLAARIALMAKEKELTRQGDRLAEERRKLPWVKVEKEYLFQTPDGSRTLAQLFDGRSQLVTYHFMFGPGWNEGCPVCSMSAGHIEASFVHLRHRDVTLIAVSRATLPEIEKFKKRMGWRFKWVSSNGTDFNFDYGVSFTKEQMASGKHFNFSTMESPREEAGGISVFYKDKSGELFHTYSIYGRGPEWLLTPYNYLDLVPKGRDEQSLPFTMAWVRHLDRYGD